MHKICEPTINSQQPSRLLAMAPNMAVVIQGTQTSTSSVTMNTRPHGWSDLIIQRRGSNVVLHEDSHDCFTIQGQNFQPNDSSIGSGCTEHMVGFVLNHRMAQWPHVQYSQAPSPYRLNMVKYASIERLGANGCHLLNVPNATSTAIPSEWSC